jgi:hypothetical protein
MDGDEHAVKTSLFTSRRTGVGLPLHRTDVFSGNSAYNEYSVSQAEIRGYSQLRAMPTFFRVIGCILAFLFLVIVFNVLWSSSIRADDVETGTYPSAP